MHPMRTAAARIPGLRWYSKVHACSCILAILDMHEVHDHAKVLTEDQASSHTTQCRIASASYAHGCRSSPRATVVSKGAWLQLYHGHD